MSSTGIRQIADTDRCALPTEVMNPVLVSRWENGLHILGLMDNSDEINFCIEVSSAERKNQSDSTMADAILRLFGMPQENTSITRKYWFWINTGWLDMSSYDSSVIAALYFHRS